MPNEVLVHESSSRALARAGRGVAPLFVLLVAAPAGTLHAGVAIFSDGFEGSLCASWSFVATFDVCDGTDNDCDSAIDEDVSLANDPENCGECGFACVNPHGSVSCASYSCVPECDPGWVQCGPEPQLGCLVLRDTTPACEELDLLAMSGDTDSIPVQRHGFGERWLVLELSEDYNFPRALTARVTLDSPDGADFDLYAYCFDCDGSLAASSTSEGLGLQETILLRASDDFGVSDNHSVLLEVRFRSASAGACDDWELEVTGNVGASTDTCNP